MTIDSLNEAFDVTQLKKIQNLAKLEAIRNSLPGDEIIDGITTDTAIRQDLKTKRQAFISALATSESTLRTSLSAKISALSNELKSIKAENLDAATKKFKLLCRDCEDTDLSRELGPLYEQLCDAFKNHPDITGRFIHELIRNTLNNTTRSLSNTLAAEVNNDLLIEVITTWNTLKQTFLQRFTQFSDREKARYTRSINDLAININEQLTGREIDTNLYPAVKPFISPAFEEQYPGIEREDYQKAFVGVKSFYATLETLGLAETLVIPLRSLEKQTLQGILPLEEYQGEAMTALNKVLTGEQALTEEQRLVINQLKIEVLSLRLSPAEKQELALILENIHKAQNLADLVKACGPENDYSTIIGLASADKGEVFLRTLSTTLTDLNERLNTDIVGTFKQYLTLLPSLTIAATNDRDIRSKQIQLARTFRINLIKNPAVLGKLPQDFYLDQAYWKSLVENIDDCTDTKELNDLASHLLQAKQTIVEGGFDKTIQIVSSLNQTMDSLNQRIGRLGLDATEGDASFAKFHRDAFAKDFPGIKLQDRVLEVGAFATPFLTILKSLHGVKTSLKDFRTVGLIEDLMRELAAEPYLRGHVDLAQYKRGLENKSEFLQENWEEIGINFSIAVHLLGMSSEYQEAFKTKVEELNQAKSLAEFYQLLNTVPTVVSQEQRGYWDFTLDKVSVPTLKRLATSLEASSKELQAQIKQIKDRDTLDACLMKFVSLRSDYNLITTPELDILRAELVEGLTLAINFAEKVGAVDSYWVKEFRLDAFSEKHLLGLLQAQITFSTEMSPPLLNKYTQAKADFEQSNFEGEEKIRNQRELNRLAVLIWEKSANDPGRKFLGTLLPERDNDLEAVDFCYDDIFRKKLSLEKDGFTDAAEAAETLLKAMDKCKLEYQSGVVSLPQYKENLQVAIKVAHGELDKHRGWKEVLINLALVVFGTLLYIGVALYQGRFFPALPVDTKSKAMLDEANETVNMLAEPSA